ncbi:MAG: SDR family oxidoreductase [Methanococcaceae archaeon]
MEIQDKVVIITGASSGIGLAAAKLFSQKKAKLALVARTASKLKQLAQELPGSAAFPTDIRDEQAVRKMIHDVYRHFGRIDVLINNAGQGMHVIVEKANIDQYRSIIELNIIGVLVAMQEVIPIMRKQKDGAIINISSGLSKRIVPTVGPYASTKYALNALSLTARLELADDNIRVGIVIPSVTETDFFKNTIRLEDSSSSYPRSSIKADSPEHVAEKILEAVITGAAEIYADSILPKS